MAGAVGAESRASALRSASRACGSHVRVLPLGFEWGRDQRGCLSVERKPIEVSRSGASVGESPSVGTSHRVGHSGRRSCGVEV